MKTGNFFFLLCVLFGIIFSGGFSSSNDLTQIDDNKKFTVTTKALKELMQTSRDLFTLCATFSICPDVKFLSKFKKTIIEKKETTNSLTPKETALRNCSKKEDCQHGYATCIDNVNALNVWTKNAMPRLMSFVSTHLIALVLASVCWGPEKSREFPEIYCVVHPKRCIFSHYLANDQEPKAERRYLQDNPKFTWKNSSTADLSKAVHAGDFTSILVFCQTVDQFSFVGTAMADFTYCSYEDDSGRLFLTQTFNILVHED
ncbi:Protein of unknown function [Cotesia congregata]|uniref:Uncharacterized protein n=1 Tax=Cotesia congregata TaxID=51543 RepID=A0A8J2EEW2_COTCN|nr:Protein of unknown function [Cotesia congregata]